MTAIKPNEKIGFVGAGNIAEALIRGLIAAGVAQAKQIFAADVSAARVEAVRSRYKVHTSTDNVRTAQQCHVVVLAVKPQIAEGVCRRSARGSPTTSSWSRSSPASRRDRSTSGWAAGGGSCAS